MKDWKKDGDLIRKVREILTHARKHHLEKLTEIFADVDDVIGKEKFEEQKLRKGIGKRSIQSAGDYLKLLRYQEK